MNPFFFFQIIRDAFERRRRDQLRKKAEKECGCSLDEESFEAYRKGLKRPRYGQRRDADGKRDEDG